METKFNFNSQVATSRSQSERLLALGLKKETADMCHRTSNGYNSYVTAWDILQHQDDIPAWSLHRLIEMMPECLTYYGDLHYISIRGHQVKYVMDGVSDGYFGCWGGYTLYDKVINCIEWLIGKGYFNKEYLV